MMEIILQRQQSRTPEEDMEIPAADVNETFETMAQRTLCQAIRSKFTVAQAQLQLEELVLKFGACIEQVVDVMAKEVSSWWETERLATGGPTSGGWGPGTVVIENGMNERVSPKVAIEKRMESFFGPLLLHFVTSLSEQRMLLQKLEEHANEDARWLKNHNTVLVALYKYDVVEAEVVVEWWKTLEEPQRVFGHGGNNLRSLNSKFVAWLEDDEDDSDTDEDDDDDDDDVGSCSEDDEDKDNDQDWMKQDEDVVESILDLVFPVSSKASAGNNKEGREDTQPQKRISFCTNKMYYTQDGKVSSIEDIVESGNDKVTKKYVQCPPFNG
ncbi:hypothetical protein B0O80DRAFT_460555 [Mortierella sp. GBAus27b]|nr:hypothetical protein B0O80DRAFT_460555 [Mortierella sp. GBAus27b]